MRLIQQYRLATGQEGRLNTRRYIAWLEDILLRQSEHSPTIPINDSAENIHPEAFCQKCHRPNPSWHAPNWLWNKVTGNRAGLIICPFCFQKMCAEQDEPVHFTTDDLITRRDPALHDELELENLQQENPVPSSMYVLAFAIVAFCLGMFGFFCYLIWEVL